MKIIARRHEYVEQIREPKHRARLCVNVFEQESPAGLKMLEQIFEQTISAFNWDMMEHIERVCAGNFLRGSPITQIVMKKFDVGDPQFLRGVARNLQAPLVHIQADDARARFPRRDIEREQSKAATQVEDVAFVREILLDLFEKADVDDFKADKAVQPDDAGIRRDNARAQIALVADGMRVGFGEKEFQGCLFFRAATNLTQRHEDTKKTILLCVLVSLCFVPQHFQNQGSGKNHFASTASISPSSIRNPRSLT